jgi:hypothetical protein
MPAVQAIQADKGIWNPLVICNDCYAIWRSVDCERCPRCARQVGEHKNTSEEQTRYLMYAVSLLNEERIERASEYTTWEFGEILRENLPWYDDKCQLTIQACYEALCNQPSNLKVDFAMGFFEQAFVDAPEDPMMYHFNDDELEYPVWSDEEDW